MLPMVMVLEVVMSKSYNSLEKTEKVQVLNLALGLYSLKPELLNDAQARSEFIGKLEEFAKELYDVTLSKPSTVMIGDYEV